MDSGTQTDTLSAPAAATAMPQPRVTWSALWEATGHVLVWAAMMVLALAWGVMVLERGQAKAQQDERINLLALEVREQLEAEASLGFELSESTRAQAALDALASRDPAIRAAEVFDASGRSLFNLDRGLLDERVPADWLTAAQVLSAQLQGSQPLPSGIARWQVVVGGDTVTGTPLIGAFGEVGGYLVVTVREPAWSIGSRPWQAIAWIIILWAILLFAAWHRLVDEAHRSHALGAELALRLQSRVQASTAALASVETIGRQEMEETLRRPMPALTGLTDEDRARDG